MTPAINGQHKITAVSPLNENPN